MRCGKRVMRCGSRLTRSDNPRTRCDSPRARCGRRGTRSGSLRMRCGCRGTRCDSRGMRSGSGVTRCGSRRPRRSTPAGRSVGRDRDPVRRGPTQQGRDATRSARHAGSRDRCSVSPERSPSLQGATRQATHATRWPRTAERAAGEGTAAPSVAHRSERSVWRCRWLAPVPTRRVDSLWEPPLPAAPARWGRRAGKRSGARTAEASSGTRARWLRRERQREPSASNSSCYVQRSGAATEGAAVPTARCGGMSPSPGHATEAARQRPRPNRFPA